VPGAVMAFKDRQGNVAYFAEGLADVATGQAMDAGMYLHIGSVTKTFTATTMLTLVDEHKVELYDTLDEWLPGQVAGGGQITIRNLLEMRSGLDHFDDKTDFFTIFYSQPQYDFTFGQLLAYGNRQINPPGQTFDYNNLNYLILEEIIEKATGQDYQQAIQDRLLTPLGLTHTSVPYSGAMPSPYAHGYINVGAGAPPEDWSTIFSVSAFGGAGSMISTVGDLVTWLGALMQGSVLSPAMHQAQWILKTVESRTNIAYGLGVASYDGALGHNGDYSHFYTAAMYRYLDYDIAVLANGQTSFSDQNSDAQKVFESVRGRLDQYLTAWD
jgi:D-alanyl-D-alanine carboxypeptidase